MHDPVSGILGFKNGQQQRKSAIVGAHNSREMLVTTTYTAVASDKILHT